MAKKKSGGKLGRLTRPVRWLGRSVGGGGTRPVLAIALLVVFLSAWYFGWQKWGPRLVRGSRYRLTAASLTITPAPPWIHTDIRAEVMRDGSLGELSVLDPDVTKRVARAFELHTWVARVLRVAKRSGKDGPIIRVDLQYREPAIMVKTGDGFWPVDTRGVLLEPNDLSPSETLEYLRLWAGDRQPVGPVGTRFGDPVVEGAARVAVALRGVWKPLGLQWITTQRGPHRFTPVPENPVYLLLPRTITSAAPDPHAKAAQPAATPASATAQVEIIWGSAPGHESVGEAQSAEKVARLAQFAQQYGPLDQQTRALEIDLRPRPGITINVRHAPHSQPASYRP